MSTRGTLFLDEAGQVHVFHDVIDNCIHIEVRGSVDVGSEREVVLTPEIWRDLLAECASAVLKTAAPTKMREAFP